MRRSASSAFDPVGRQGVLYGGSDTPLGCPTGATLDDLWLFRQGSWTPVTPDVTSELPGPRCDAGFAYDRARNEMVLFAWSDADSNLFQWTSSGWAGSPLPAITDQMAFMPGSNHDNLVFRIGAGILEAFPAGLAAVTMGPGSPPISATGAAISTDLMRNRVMFVGGFSAIGFPLSESIDLVADPADQAGLVWQAPPGGTPTARGSAAMAYNPVKKRMVLFGGDDPTGGGLLNDTWLYDSIQEQWRQAACSNVAQPAARKDAALSYVPDLDAMMLFGGRDGSGDLTDSWLLVEGAAGNCWETLSIVDVDGRSGETLTPGAQLVFDKARGQLLAVGGRQRAANGATPGPLKPLPTNVLTLSPSMTTSITLQADTSNLGFSNNAILTSLSVRFDAGGSGSHSGDGVELSGFYSGAWQPLASSSAPALQPQPLFLNVQTTSPIFQQSASGGLTQFKVHRPWPHGVGTDEVVLSYAELRVLTTLPTTP